MFAPPLLLSSFLLLLLALWHFCRLEVYTQRVQAVGVVYVSKHFFVSANRFVEVDEQYVLYIFFIIILKKHAILEYKIFWKVLSGVRECQKFGSGKRSKNFAI